MTKAGRHCTKGQEIKKFSHNEDSRIFGRDTVLYRINLWTFREERATPILRLSETSVDLFQKYLALTSPLPKKTVLFRHRCENLKLNNIYKTDTTPHKRKTGKRVVKMTVRTEERGLERERGRVCTSQQITDKHKNLNVPTY
jgi:hypothetical protein